MLLTLTYGVFFLSKNRFSKLRFDIIIYLCQNSTNTARVTSTTSVIYIQIMHKYLLMLAFCPLLIFLMKLVTEDLFQIVEFSMHTGEELQDSDYSVSGDIMDGHLYDLLMNLLEERGVTNEFAEQLIDLSTSYEHGLYINLLEKLRDFVSK